MNDETHSFPPLLLRLTIGPTMFVHGYNKAFGKGGIKGTEGWFEGIGFRPAAVHARVAAATEMGSGILLTVGALNPLPSAAVVGIMAVAARTDHRDNGFFMFKNGWEYVGILGVAATALAGMGYGKWSVDHLRGRQRRGFRWALLAAGLGVANAALVLKSSFDPDREPDPGPSEVIGETAADNGSGPAGDLDPETAGAFPATSGGPTAD